MFTTCLFCSSDLGQNQALEHFPVGRRLAFDAANGRLWVVCRRCERWNLTPLEERWEAIEEAEQQFSNARQRVSTENIGLARLQDATELVRVGKPQRPEFAAWRYGDQFGRRRKRQMLIAAGSLTLVGVAATGGALAGASIAAFAGLIGNSINAAVHGRAEKIVARLRTEAAGTVAVRRRHLAETQLLTGQDGPLALYLRFKGGSTHIEGREALRVAAALVPHVNRFGGKPQEVQSAVKLLEDAGGPEGYLARLRDHAGDTTAVRLKGGTRRKRATSWSGAYNSGLFGLSAADRLAVEMALHEEAEMRALRGELEELERAWRDAKRLLRLPIRC